MARRSPANQHTSATKTAKGNDGRASKSMIAIGDDLV